MKGKLTLLTLALALLLALLTACGGANITDAKSLAAANIKAQAAVENHHMDMNMDMTMAIDTERLKEAFGTSSLEMPVLMNVAVDSGRYTAHANTNMNVTIMEQETKQQAELYLDMKNGITYAKADGVDAWKRAEETLDMSAMLNSLGRLEDSLLENAIYSESSDAYTLTLSADPMDEVIKDMDLLGSLRSAGLDVETLTVDGGQMVYTIDKNSLLITSIAMKDIDVTASGVLGGTSVDMSIPLDAEVTFSKYGELMPEDYEIPDDVLDDASAASPTLPIENKDETE